MGIEYGYEIPTLIAGATNAFPLWNSELARKSFNLKASVIH